MEQWNNLKTVTTKVQVKQTKMNRVDSTTIVDIAMAVQVDSRKLKTIAKKIENKTNRIIDILFEE
jgi:phosphoribosyl-dephospho-CoA transferase